MATTDEHIIDVCLNSMSMAEAAAKTDLHYNTFSRRAKKLGVYKPNQGKKGGKKARIEGRGKIPLSEILKGNYPQYQTFKLKNRLIENNIKENICEICNIGKWNGKELKCELDHINGISTDHRLENLRILCPNCHSQTDTFRSKNIKK